MTQKSSFKDFVRKTNPLPHSAKPTTLGPMLLCGFRVGQRLKHKHENLYVEVIRDHKASFESFNSRHNPIWIKYSWGSRKYSSEEWDWATNYIVDDGA